MSGRERLVIVGDFNANEGRGNVREPERACVVSMA